MTATFDDQYNMLNDQQRLAVGTIEGPVMVTAGPGTGKTQILTLRIANILRVHGSDTAINILALTFTNAGVTSMRQRLASFIGAEAYQVNIFTFHSFAEHLIQKYSEKFGGQTGSRSASDFDRIQIVEEIIKSERFEFIKPFADPLFNTQNIIRAIDELKSEYISPDDFEESIAVLKDNITADEASYYKRATKTAKAGDIKPNVYDPVGKNTELLSVYQLYQQALEQQNLYDYNDMISWVIVQMRTDEDFLYDLQEQYQYLLVDEHQDSNNSQNTIVELLASAKHLEGRPNVFTVGDDKQAIYRFQGASVENFSYFKNQYTDVVEIHLETNYRSQQHVLDASHNLITSSEEHADSQTLTAFHGQKEAATISLAELETHDDELVFLAHDISQKIVDGVDPSDIAVLYRKNSNLESLRSTFAKANIPTVISSKQNILLDKDMAKLLLVMRAIAQPANLEAVGASLFVDFLGISSLDAVDLLKRRRIANVLGEHDLVKLLSDEAKLKTLKLRSPKTVLKYGQMLSEAITFEKNSSFNEFFEWVLQESGFLQYILAQTNSAEKLAFVRRLHTEVKKLIEANPNFTLSDFVEYIDMIGRYNISIDTKTPAAVSGVRLMTAHGSKGLEFDHVYITNFVDGNWGGNKNGGYGIKFDLPTNKIAGDNSDERRLFYVAMTRAKRSVTISYAKIDAIDREKVPSRFLFEIDGDLIQSVDLEKRKSAMVELKQSLLGEKATITNSIFSDELVQQLFTAMPLSITALNSYVRCPGQYFLRTMLRLPIGYRRSLIYGSVMHRSLELYFAACKSKQEVLGQHVLIELFEKELSNSFLPKNEHADLLQQGTKSLSGYYDQYHSEFSLDIELEYPVRGVDYATVDSIALALTGKLDVVQSLGAGLDLGSGKVRVIDFKTGKSYSDKSSKDDKHALDRQLAFYQLLLDNYRGGSMYMSEGVLDFIEPNKKGQYERRVLQVTDTELDSLRGEIDTMAREVMAGISFLDKRCDKAECESCQMLAVVNL